MTSCYTKALNAQNFTQCFIFSGFIILSACSPSRFGVCVFSSHHRIASSLVSSVYLAFVLLQCLWQFIIFDVFDVFSVCSYLMSSSSLRQQFIIFNICSSLSAAHQLHHLRQFMKASHDFHSHVLTAVHL